MIDPKRLDVAENKEKILAFRIAPLTMSLIKKEYALRKIKHPWKRATVTAIVTEAIHAFLDPKSGLKKEADDGATS